VVGLLKDPAILAYVILQAEPQYRFPLLSYGVEALRFFSNFENL